MSTSQKNNEEEVDLGSLFVIIGKGFSNLFNFIGNIFKGIFHFIISILIFLKQRVIKIVIAATVGLIAGIFLEVQTPTRYGSELLLEPNLLSLIKAKNISGSNKNENKKIFDSLINEGLMNEKGELFYSASRVKFTLIQTPNGYSTVFRVCIPDSASQDITSFARKELENELKYLEYKEYISKFGITGSPASIANGTATNAMVVGTGAKVV